MAEVVSHSSRQFSGMSDSRVACFIPLCGPDVSRVQNVPRPSFLAPLDFLKGCCARACSHVMCILSFNQKNPDDGRLESYLKQRAIWTNFKF